MTRAERTVRRCVWLLALLLALATAWGWQRTPAMPPMPAPLADLLTVPEAHAETGWTVASLHAHPGVLIVEFPSLAVQGESLNRAAALIEKQGAPRDRLLDDEALAAFIESSGGAPATFLYGHDYSSVQLARLFGLAASQGLALKPAERALFQLLQDRGMFRQGAPAWEGVDGRALVTIARSQPDDPATPEDDSLDPALRAAILRHELSHGVYFVDARYREACRALWRQDLTDAEREAIRVHFAHLGYARDDDDLMANELQAFLLHTPAPHGLDDAHTGIAPARLAQWRAALARRLNGRLPLHLN